MRPQDRRSDVYEAEAAQAATQRQAVCVAEMPEVQRGIYERTRTERTIKRAAFIGTRRVGEVSRDAHDTYLDLGVGGWFLARGMLHLLGLMVGFPFSLIALRRDNEC